MTGRSKTSFFPFPSLSSIPLPGIFQLITATILLLLTCVLFLGVHQYGLYHQCSQAVRTSDRLLFEFSAARDVISESIVGNKTMDLTKLTSSLQSIKDNAKTLEDNVLLPDALKRELINGRDMVNILAGMQSLQTRTQNTESEKWAFIKKVNELHNRLQQFRINLSDHTRIILQGLHKTIIGTLGIIIVACCCLLFYINRTIGSPLVQLCKLLPPSPGTSRKPGKSGKVVVSMNELVRSAGNLKGFQQGFTSLLNDLTKDDPPARYARLCTHLLSMEGVLFAWIAETVAGKVITPVGCESSLDIPQEKILHSLTGIIRQDDPSHPLMKLLDAAMDKGMMQQSKLNLQDLFHQEKVINEKENHNVLIIPVMDKDAPRLLLGIHYQKSTVLPEYYLHSSIDVASLLSCRQQEETAKVLQPTGVMDPAYVMHRHLYSVHGAMGAETASALTNSINGSINHCQQLIDMVEAGRDPDIMVVILERIIREGKKSAALVGSMAVTERESMEMLSPAEIKTFLESMQLILEKPMLAEAIRLNLDCDDELTGRVPAALFKLITATFIHLGRKSVLTGNGRPKNTTQTLLSLTAGLTNHDHESSHISVTCTITPGMWQFAGLDNDPAWPAYAQCLELMQQFGGEIITTENRQKECVQLIFPSHATHSPSPARPAVDNSSVSRPS